MPHIPRFYEFGTFRLEVGERVLYAGDRPVSLTPKAIDTLLALVQRPGVLVTKDELLRTVWPNAFVEENNLAQNVSLLRRVLGDGTDSAGFIETVKTRGYRFVAPVAERFGESLETATPVVEVRAPPVVVSAAARVQPASTAWMTLLALVAAGMVLGMWAIDERRGTASRNEIPVAHAAASARATEDPDARLAFLRGIAAFQNGFSDTTNQALARTSLEHAVARDPTFALAWSWLSRVYTAQYRSGSDRTANTREAAYRAARTAIEIDGGLVEAHLALAQALFGDREYAAARAEVDLARRGMPDSSETWQLLGHIEQTEGRWKDARKAFMRAFDLDPSGTAQWVTVHYLHTREYAEARRFIGIARAANQAGSVVPEAWLAFSESGDLSAARPILQTALGARTPSDARVLGYLARLEWFDGRPQRALELIQGMDRAGSWLPANFRFPAAVAAGQVLHSTGRHAEARERYATALPDLLARERRSPDDYQVQAALGLTLLGLGRHEEALRHSQRATQILPVEKDAVEGVVYVYLLAQVQAQTGNLEAAFATLDRLFDMPGFYNERWVERDPGFQPLWGHPSFRAHVARWAMQRGDALLERPPIAGPASLP